MVATVEELTGSGNWTVPTGVTSVTVHVWGGGAGGGGGGPGFTTGGAGGASGGYSSSVLTVTPGDVIPYVVGAGGTGGTGGGAQAGSARSGIGGNSWFNSTALGSGVSAQGGQRGTNSYDSGAGGAAASGSGTTTTSGTAGRASGAFVVPAGGGSGAPGPSGAGGQGGTADNTSAYPGGGGGAPNGGGAGSNGVNASGAGGAGGTITGGSAGTGGAAGAGGNAGLTGNGGGGAGITPASAAPGGAGSAQPLFTLTAGGTRGPGSGGGGGGGGSGATTFSAGGAAGGFGAGGGGGGTRDSAAQGANGGAGAPGGIILEYDTGGGGGGAVVVRRGGMGLGLGLGFSFGGGSGSGTPSPSPTPTPTPSPAEGFDYFPIMAFAQNPTLPARSAGTYAGESWPAQTLNNNHYATLLSWGINTVVGYDGVYGGDVKVWDAAATSAGMKLVRRPISQFNSGYGFGGAQYGPSDLAYDVALSTLVAWGLQDEPETGDKYGQDLIDLVRGQIDEVDNAGYLGQKLLTQNLVGASVNGYIEFHSEGGINGLKTILTYDEINVWLSDFYPDIYQTPMLTSGNNSGGFYKTTTEQGAELHNFIRGYWNGSAFVPAGSAGKPAITHIWPGRGNYARDGSQTYTATPATFGVQFGSSIINGAAGIGLFLTGFDGSGGFQTFCYLHQMPTVLEAVQDHIANVNNVLIGAAEGDVLMDSTTKNRRTYTLLECQNTTTDPNGASPTLGSIPTNGLPWPFEGCDIDMGGGVHYRLVHSLHATSTPSLSLTGHSLWGTVNMGTFVPGRWKIFKSTAPTVDLCTWSS
jgi:hypothetical protein